MKNILRRIVMVLLLAVMLASCSTERRALHQMRGLTTQIENHGYNYTNDQWREAYADYQRIDEKMDVKKLTPEEQREYGELQARCIKEFAKCKVDSVIGSIRAYLNQGAGLLHGLLELLK